MPDRGGECPRRIRDGTGAGLAGCHHRGSVPSFDGKAARTLALQRCPQVPFIFYSGGDVEVLKAKAVALAAQTYVSKKDLDRLDDVVRKVCGW